MSDEQLAADGTTELYRITRYEVYDPWTGHILAEFTDQDQAEDYMKMFAKKKRKNDKSK